MFNIILACHHMHTLVPSAPTNVFIVATYSTSISIQWDASKEDGGSPITSYVVEYCINSDPVSEPKTELVGSNTFLVTLGDLTPSTKYNVWVRAVNGVGHSVRSTSLQVQTDPDGEFIE